MKALTLHAFGEQLAVTERTLPQVQAGEVKVRVHAAGINPSDVYTTTGTYAVKPDLPYTPGLDGAGVIVEVGDGVTHQVGQRVFIASLPYTATGTIAQDIICAARHVFPLPDGVTFEQGAALGIPAFTAYRALVQRGQLTAGQTVLIHGASGAVGLAAVQIAKALGARVIGTASRLTGKELVQQAGADIVCDHLHAANVAQLLDYTNGEGPDLIIECLANENLSLDLQVVKKRGAIVIVGNRGEITLNPRLIMQKECDVRGMILFNMTDEEHVAIARSIGELLEVGKLQPIIGQAFPLEQANEAFAAVLAGTYNGKVVIHL